MPMFPLVGLCLGVSLALFGLLLDRSAPLDQLALFSALQLASLAGMGTGLAAMTLRAQGGRQVVLFAGVALIGWRLAYFPVMVFSGHVASIGEWLLLLAGLPVFVYPTFLLAVAAQNAAAAALVISIVSPPRPLLRYAAIPAFVLAALVSFTKPADLRPLPDTATSLDRPIPPLRTDGENPYLPALFGPGYWPNQRVVLVAAGLTYGTIPPSPWATTVKSVLGELFSDQPYGSTADRVLEHYLAYHAAHPRIGCRRAQDCPISP